LALILLKQILGVLLELWKEVKFPAADAASPLCKRGVRGDFRRIRPTNSALVNGLPWSVLKIPGLPWRWTASSTASMQKSVVKSSD